MRTCEEYRELISLAIDDEITPDEMRDLQRHLLVCEECRSVYRAFAAISDSLSDSISEAPEGFAEGVMSRIGARSRPARKRRFAWGSFAAVAACFVIVAVAVSKIGFDGWKSRSGDGALSGAYYVSESTGADPAEQNAADAEQADGSMDSVLYDLSPEEDDVTDSSATLAGDSTADAPASEESVQEPQDGGQRETEGAIADSPAGNSAAANSAGTPDEAMAMLTGLTGAEIYTGDVSDSSSAEPNVSTTSADALAALAELLSFSELSEAERPQDEPLFTVVAQDGETGKFEIRIWLSDNRLIIEFGENGTLYVANGTLADLLEFIENA